jgi:hypothetical protein
MPDDIIERDHIIPKFLGGKNAEMYKHYTAIVIEIKQIRS